MTDSTSPRILVTGFEPFEQDPVNPSWEVARALHGEIVEGATVHGLQLRCVFGESLRQLQEALAQLQPVLVISLGLAGGRSEFTPERVAINIDDARIPDHAARQPVDQVVIPGAPAAYFSTLPIKAVVHNLRARGIPSSVSNTAGTFVCNHVFSRSCTGWPRARLRRVRGAASSMCRPCLSRQRASRACPACRWPTRWLPCARPSARP